VYSIATSDDMKAISLDDAIQLAFDALLGDRLALLCGAGLSMADPSNLPSAGQLAERVRAKYAATYGASRPGLPKDLGQQAQFFLTEGS
jgi:hypothetical protein